ncbi:MAG: bifunctional UDP-N-acetylglucosamine diphosphorylase/glucosamine-1-phosphate N-acetyltransferase GlmU [Pseudomonadota bacterium]
MGERVAVILAAGKGTRMKSDVPKVLHKVAGRAMVDWSVDLARSAGCSRTVVVCSPGQDRLIDYVEATLGPNSIAIQDPPLGTGHAVQAAEEMVGRDGHLVVLYGDTPLIRLEAVEGLFAALEDGAAIGVLGFEAADPGQYGRLIKAADGSLDRIVEAREASADELAVTLCNSGVMAASASDMFGYLSNVTNDNAKGEFYLTDVVGLAHADGRRSAVIECDEADVQGCNDRTQLADTNAAFQVRRRREAMAEGVTLEAPETVYFSYDTELGRDTIVEPNVVFGPGVRIETGATIRAFSHLEGAVVKSGAVIGPYARLRPGADIGEHCRIGNFVEVKNVAMASGAKANHLAYLGDGEVGVGANLGAGTIFCNYDGFNKSRTVVGAGAFVGSNSALIAPVTIGDGAYVGSGSVITDDVDPDALAVARGRQVQKKGWATEFRDSQSKSKSGD